MVGTFDGLFSLGSPTIPLLTSSSLAALIFSGLKCEQWITLSDSLRDLMVPIFRSSPNENREKYYIVMVFVGDLCIVR